MIGPCVGNLVCVVAIDSVAVVFCTNYEQLFSLLYLKDGTDYSCILTLCIVIAYKPPK